jgi:hypothetical protein
MYRYQVGQLYSPTRRRWPEDVDYNFRAGQHELRLFFRNPSAVDIDAIARGPCEFALLRGRDTFFFLYHFGDAVPWSDKPFSWWLVPEDERVTPKTADFPEPHDLLSIILVNADSGIIKALRVVTFSPAFTAAIRLAIADQAKYPFVGDAAYEAQIRAYYARYPSVEDMLPDAIARTVGGR